MSRHCRRLKYAICALSDMTVASGRATLCRCRAAGSSSTGWRESVTRTERTALGIEGMRIHRVTTATTAPIASPDSRTRPTHRAISKIANAANPL